MRAMVVCLGLSVLGLACEGSPQGMVPLPRQGLGGSPAPSPACGPGGTGGAAGNPDGGGNSTAGTAGNSEGGGNSVGGAAGRPDAGGNSTGGMGGAPPTCAGATTCPGTTSGRWCVETLTGQPTVNLESVWSDRPDDVWVVGWQNSTTSPGRVAILMRWDGCVWTNVPNPDPTRFDSASGVWGSAADDVWIVGEGLGALHFDGESLQFVPIPVPPNTPVVDFRSVSGTASNDVWASGDQVLHWDGEAWTAVSIPPDDPSQFWADVWAVGPSDVWVTGDQVAAHFDGSSWTVDTLITGQIGATSFLLTIWSSGAETWAAGLGGQIDHFANGQWTSTVPATDTGPGFNDLGGLNGDVHLVGDQGTVDILEEGSFLPVTDAPPQALFYDGVWVSPSQVWMVGTDTASQPRIIPRAR
jgi:hypothetical protein